MFEIARNAQAGYRRNPVGNPEGQDVTAASLSALASAHGVHCGVLAAPFAAEAFAACSGQPRTYHQRGRKVDKLHSFANSED